MRILVLLFICVIFVNNICAYKILAVLPFPGKSTTILGDGYVRHLLKAGHEVTYITAIPMKPHPNLKQVELSSLVEGLNEDLKALDFKNILAVGNELREGHLYNIILSLNNRTLHHENLQNFLLNNNEKYDVIISQWIYSELMCGFAAIFNTSYIWTSSFELHPMILRLIDEPQNPAYFRDHTSPVAPPLKFTERISELWRFLRIFLIRWRMSGIEEKVFKDAYGPAAAKRGIKLPLLEELKYKSSLVLGNSHVAVGDAYKLPQNYIPIAGYHIEEDVKPLPEKFQRIMDEAKDGVIYFSMGSVIKSKTMPQEMKRDLLRVFSELKQVVIWKLEEEMENLPNNVHIVEWAPQQSILAHPNCVLFVSHGGLLSISETIHYGVPMIGIPLFADHDTNMIRVLRKGFGLRLDLSLDMPANLKVVIQEILTNNKYREKVKELSFIYHHRPVKPGAAIVHWVEHVIETKGALHLQSPALHIPLYQKLYLDFLGVLFVFIILLLILIKMMVHKLKKIGGNVLEKKTK